MKGYSIKVLNFILNQINLESNFGQSNLAKTLKNCIGMRCVSIRKTTQLGCFTTPNNGNFGMYATILDCVQDRFLWGEYFKESKTNLKNVKELASTTYCSADVYYTKKIDDLPNLEWCIWLVIIAIPMMIILPISIIQKLK